jgi:hypothetical protein
VAFLSESPEERKTTSNKNYTYFIDDDIDQGREHSVEKISENSIRR